MAENLLKELVSRIVEGKLREMEDIEISDGRYVKYGSNEHLEDIDKCIADMTRIRNRHKKGSAARENYSRALSRLKVEREKALKRAEQTPTGD